MEKEPNMLKILKSTIALILIFVGWFVITTVLSAAVTLLGGVVALLTFAFAVLFAFSVVAKIFGYRPKMRLAKPLDNSWGQTNSNRY